MSEPEPPGEVDAAAVRILEEAASSPDGRLEIDSILRSQFERYQGQFYMLLGIEEHPTDELIAGVLDRISLAIPKAVANCLKMYLSPKDGDSPNRSWGSIRVRLDLDMYEIHLSPLRELTCDIYYRYHKLSKPQPFEVIDRFSRDKAQEDFHRLGEEFQKLLWHPPDQIRT